MRPQQDISFYLSVISFNAESWQSSNNSANFSFASETEVTYVRSMNSCMISFSRLLNMSRQVSKPIFEVFVPSEIASGSLLWIDQ